MNKIVKEISPDILQVEVSLQDISNYNNIESHRQPWETVYIIIENAHGCYPETHHGYYKSLEEAEKWLEIFCKTYGGRIEQTTWGEINNIRI